MRRRRRRWSAARPSGAQAGPATASEDLGPYRRTGRRGVGWQVALVASRLYEPERSPTLLARTLFWLASIPTTQQRPGVHSERPRQLLQHRDARGPLVAASS